MTTPEIIAIFLLIAILKYCGYLNKIKKGLGYYVFCPQASAPRHIHETYESAYKEAKRLQNKYPYSDFQILKIEHHIMGIRIEDDEIPF